MSKSAYVSGSKIASSHGTTLAAAKPLIEAIARLESVTNIALGARKPGLRGMPPSARCLHAPVGVEVTVKSGEGRQTIYVYTSSRDEVAVIVRAFFPRGP